MDLRHSTYPPIILAEKNIESDSIEIRQQNEMREKKANGIRLCKVAIRSESWDKRIAIMPFALMVCMRIEGGGQNDKRNGESERESELKGKARETEGERERGGGRNVLSSTWRFYCNAKIDMSRKLSIYLYRPKWKLAFKSQNNSMNIMRAHSTSTHNNSRILGTPGFIHFHKIANFWRWFSHCPLFVRLKTIIWFSSPSVQIYVYY